jgi:hypothetical protein
VIAWWDPPAFERYAAALHQAPWLPAAEVGLLALLLLHHGRSGFEVGERREAGVFVELPLRPG